MELQEFVRTHSLIKWNAIEKQLGIPRGTIRQGGRRIPEKYVKQVEEILAPYGYGNGLIEMKPRSEGWSKQVTDNINELEKCKKDPKYFMEKYCLIDGKSVKWVPESTTSVLKKGKEYIIRNNQLKTYDGILYRPVSVPDGTKVIVVDSP